MTSRPPPGVPPRQPQRGHGSKLAAQRPSHPPHSLSQQFLSTSASPARRDAPADAPAGVPADATDHHVPGRHHAATPRRGGSKLRLELFSEWNIELSPTHESPQIPTPSRAAPLSAPDATDNNKPSPAHSRDLQPELENLPLPMPKRRPPLTERHATASRPPAAATAPPKDARPKPYTVQVPADAPRFISVHKHDIPNRDPFSKGLHTGYADFFPWSGQHYEDEWSPDAIQKGTWDQGTQHETASARLAVLPALRQKKGINALSTVFMGVVNHRRFRGQILSPSTFKPPPRVTLTDTKREMWLIDLANSTISLRRLSRTIPHGIRGRILLDQCLNKNVPTERAMWLAKCVCANEIRAFKRKGAGGAFIMGGESKWVRDWTGHVEQFVEATLSGFSEPDWKARTTYAIRLATNLYSEHLLDRDHYLDWIASGLENSPQSRLPMWILVAQITWADLVRSRRHGRRLVYTLLGHLNSIHKDPDRDILIQLSSQLTSELRTLLANNPESFLSPGLWPRHQDALKAFLLPDDVASQGALQRVNARNARLVVTNNSTSRPAGRQHLFKLLDSTMQGPSDRKLPAKCLAAVNDKVELVKAVVEWATSVHRPGVAKAYVATRFLKAWSTPALSTTQVILDILVDICPSDKLRKKAVFHLITELVRSGLFSVPKYMQWLIGRGGLHDAADIDPDDGPCESRLMVELPIHYLSESQKTQRGNLLRRAGKYSILDEANDISSALACVDDTLGFAPHLGKVVADRKRLPLRKLLRRTRNSSKAVQTSIGAHLCDALTSNLLDKVDTAVALSIFVSVRLMLETTQDFFSLCQILKYCAATSNVDVLAAGADTINSHLEIFLSLGTADTLFDELNRRIKSINCKQGVSRPLLAALCSLAQRLPNREVAAKQLLRDLEQSDRSSAIEVCSPVSDSMVVQTQNREIELSEKIDKLLASGNMVDAPTMNRLFREIIPKVEDGWAKADGRRTVFASLLSRLRVFDAQHFDKLMADWINHVGTLRDRPKLSELYPLLVNLGCLSVSTLLQVENAAPASMEQPPVSPGKAPSGAAVYLQELLALVVMKLPKSGCLESVDIYRFEIQQKSARSEHAKALLLLMRNALAEYAAMRSFDPMCDSPLDNTVCKDGLVETLRYLVVADSTAVTNILHMANLPRGAVNFVDDVITRLLIPGDNGRSPLGSFDQLLGLANELTIPFCQLKLTLDLSETGLGTGELKERGPSRFEAFAKAMDRAIEARNITWTGMLPFLSPDINRNLSTQALARFLDILPSLKSPGFDDEATSDHHIHLAENLLEVMEVIKSGQPPSRSAHLTASLVEKLCDLWEIVASQDEDRARARNKVFCHWLPALLRFIVLHSASYPEPLQASNPNQPAPASAPTPSQHDARARIILVLCGLLLELDSRPETADGTLSQQVFDVAVFLVDGLPDEMRLQCAKSVLYLPGGASGTSTSDPRLYYLFSMQQPTWAEKLKLAHKDRASIAYSAAARGLSAMYGIGPASQERFSPYVLRRWEVLSEPTPNVGENDTSLSLGLFEAIKMQ